MTAPVPPQQPTPEQVETDQATGEIAALLAALLLVSTAVVGARAVTAAARRALLATYEARRIIQILITLRVSGDVAAAVFTTTVTRSPLPGTNRAAPASAAARRANQTENLRRRAAYIVQASRRVQDAVDKAAVPDNVRPLPGVPAPPQPDPAEQRRAALIDALRHEAVYRKQHVRAQQERNAAARRLDEARDAHGDRLGWYARTNPDGSFQAGVTALCREAHHRDFFASRRPAIGYPGLVIEHPGCLCSPGPPLNNGRTVYALRDRDEQ